jgi:4-carboxymuconolactone decarboxylase
MTKDRIGHSIGRGRRVGLAAGLTVLSLGGALAQPATAPPGPGDVASRDAVRAVAPALDRYTQEVILGDLWRRPGLTPRERSIVTVSVLIARGQTIEMPEQFATALENGVEPRQLSEVITHLAFYAGHANAVAAALVARDVFAQRGVTAAQLPPATSTLLPLDAAAEEQRRSAVEGQFGTVSPPLLRYTTDVLFRDLWLRPDLAPRERSMVTVSALIAAGQMAQLTPHLTRAMDNGLTRDQASELVAQAAFYAGWPNAFSALSVMKGVFESRPN